MEQLTRHAILTRLRVVAAQTFDCAEDALMEDSIAADIRGWDSLSHTIFVMSVEEAFGIEFDAEKVFAFSNVADLITAIAKAGA